MKLRHRKLSLPLYKRGTQVIHNRIKLPLQVIEDICSLCVELLREEHVYTHTHTRKSVSLIENMALKLGRGEERM